MFRLSGISIAPLCKRNATAAAAFRWRTFTETCAADVTARVVFGLDDVIISLDVVLNIGVTGAALPIVVDLRSNNL